MKKPQCKNCLMFNHWSYQCFNNRKIKTVRPKKSAKPKTHQPTESEILWMATKRKWFKANPPIEGYYYCHYCLRVLVKNDELNDFGVEYVTLDHKVNRRNSKLKYDLGNLLPCCFRCNSLKGSRSYESFCREFYPRLLELDS